MQQAAGSRTPKPAACRLLPAASCLLPLWRGDAVAKYGRKASKKVERAMHERKHGTLKSGRSGKMVKSRKQAIAIGLPEAREEGAKVPKRKSSTSSSKKR
jgi:hypothetical protein